MVIMLYRTVLDCGSESKQWTCLLLIFHKLYKTSILLYFVYFSPCYLYVLELGGLTIGIPKGNKKEITKHQIL